MIFRNAVFNHVQEEFFKPTAHFRRKLEIDKYT